MLMLAACTPRETAVDNAEVRATALTEVTVAEARAAGDGRVLTPLLRSAALGADTPVRAAAVAAIGALDDESGVPLLELALADREAAIRVDAARALARHPAHEPGVRATALLGAYAAAPSANERIVLEGLLADTQATAKSAWLTRALNAPDALQLEAACLALGRLASRGHSPLPSDALRVLELIEHGQGSVQGACASVLSEPVARETLRTAGAAARAVSALAKVARSPDLDSALLATQALAAYGSDAAARELKALAGSSSPGIALESVRGLRRTLSPSALAAAATRQLEQLRPTARSGAAGILLELLDALIEHPDAPEADATAQRVLAASAERIAGAGGAAPLEWALLDCAGARLADAARRWPRELLSCGHGRVPDPLRDAWIAEAFGRAEGSDDLRAVQLTRLFEKGPSSVRRAAVAASATLPVNQASALLRLALRDEDPLVIAAASRAVSARPSLRNAAPDDRLGVPDLLQSVHRAGEHVESSTAWLLAARALARSAPPNVASGSDPDTPIKPATGSPRHTQLAHDASPQEPETVRVSAPPTDLIEHVTQLARHPAWAVRGPALALLSEWQAPLPSDVLPVQSPLAADRMPKRGALFHVKLKTTAGAIELELDTQRTPIAAVRFVELVRKGALDGLPVAQLARGRAVSFLPLEGPTLRHEDIADVVHRGSVVLQDHGRDALGPGFALMLARAPSLDRRASVIGRVTAGLEVVDALLPIDTILEAQVTTDPR